MSVEPKKALSKLRTFAQDLEAQRKKDGITTPPQADAAAVAKGGSHIPAFHELQKKTPAVSEPTPIYAAPTYTAEPKTIPSPPLPTPPINQPPAAKKIVVQAKKNPTKTGGGKIITDNKNNRVKLLPALFTSFNTWLSTTLTSLKKKEPPKYTVTDAERRKGVIQKSTTKTGSIFTADNETLKEEIRRRQLQSVSPAPHKNDITWTPNTEVGYPLLESASRPPIKTTNVQVDFKRQTVASAPVIVESPVPEAIVPPPAPAVVAPPEIIIPEVIAPPEKTIRSELELDPVIVTVEPEQPVYEVPYTPPPQPTAPKARWSFDLQKIKGLNTNTQTIVIVGLIGGIILMIFIVRGILNITSSDLPTIETVAPAEPITTVTSVTDLTLAALTKNDLLRAIASTPATSQTVSEFRFVDNSGAPINTQVLLQSFAFTTNPNFTQSVIDLHLVTVGSQKALVFKVVDPTTVFGALLEWEPVMLAELSGVFGLSTLPANESFTDATIGQRDVRTLMAGGEQVLVYGFTDINVVVITENTTVFKTILDGQ